MSALDHNRCMLTTPYITVYYQTQDLTGGLIDSPGLIIINQKGAGMSLPRLTGKLLAMLVY